MEKSDITIYIAAALFNGRETYFNQALVEEIEKRGYKTKFPQRNGFEFGNLHKALKNVIPNSEIFSAVQTIIYQLDMGVFIPQSHVVLANLDEPQDEGVLVELAHAKNLHRQTIGFRTDVRTPYGTASGDYNGMHFFPALYLLDTFIPHYMPCKNSENAKKEVATLVDKIEKALPKLNFSSIFPSAHPLFSGIENIHSNEGLKEIAKRCINKREELAKSLPKIIH